MWTSIVAFFSSIKILGRIIDFLELIDKRYLQYRLTKITKKTKALSVERKKITERMSKGKTDEELKKLHSDLHS